MLHYNGSWMRTGINYSIKEIDDNFGPMHSSERYHVEVAFKASIRPDVNMQILIDVFNNQLQDSIDIVPYTFFNKFHMKEFIVELNVKEFFVCSGIIYAKDAKYSDLNIPREPESYYTNHELSIFYNAILKLNDEPIKVSNISLDLVNHIMKIRVSGDVNKEGVICKLRLHTPDASKVLGDLNINCIYSHPLYKVDEYTPFVEHILLMKDFTWNPYKVDTS